MAIVTISRGTYTKGREIAEKVAAKLGYECIAREAVIEASKEFNIQEAKLIRALHDAPSVLDKFSYGKEKFIAYYQVAFLERMKGDNVVYHGLAGHFLLKNISHVLKVRIIADIEERAKLEAEREKISEKEALRLLQNDDVERKRWSHHVYGIDTDDSSLYDLVVRIRKITVDDAVDIIAHTAGLEHFKTTPQSKEAFDDMLIAAKVRVAILEKVPNAEVVAKKGVVYIRANSSKFHEDEFINGIEQSARSVSGVKDINVYIIPVLPYDD